MSSAWGQISHDFARIFENNSIFGQNLQKIKKNTNQQNSSYEWPIFKFSELSLKIKSENLLFTRYYNSTIIELFTNPQLIMGLDMYLHGTKNFSVFTRNSVKPPLEKTFEFTSLVNNHGLENAPIDYDTPWSNYDIKFPIMYWRKSNQIHQWFVQNVQGGKDNCAEYSVSLDQLKLLSKTIEPALVSTAAASELLPTTEGFFFGSQEYDEYYFEDLKQTKEKIDSLIAYQTAAENAQKCRWLNLKIHNGNMSEEEFNKKFPTLTKDVPFDDFIYWSSW